MIHTITLFRPAALFVLAVSFSTLLYAQPAAQHTLQIEDLTRWNRITDTHISPDGRWVAYTLDAEDGDPTTILYDGQQNVKVMFERADKVQLSADNRYAVLLIHPPEDTVKDMRRRKVDKEDLPGDTLLIYRLDGGQMEKIPEVRSFQLPEKWSGWVSYLAEPAADTTQTNRKRLRTKNGNGRLIIRQLGTGQQVEVAAVKDYVTAEAGPFIAMVSEGQDSTFASGVYLYDTEQQQLRPLHRQKGKYKRLTFDETGQRLAFVADLDTTEARVRPFSLHLYHSGQDSAQLILASGEQIMEAGWTVSEHRRLQFAEDGSKLYFGIAPPPFLVDTTLLKEEIPQVEVWTTGDARLYTRQKVQLDQDKKQAYLSVYHIADNKLVQLADEEVPDIRLGNEGMSEVALGSNDSAYLKLLSHEGAIYRDLYKIDVRTGNRRDLGIVAKGSANVSPAGKFFYWYSNPDSAWMAYSVADDQLQQVTDLQLAAFYDELNDRPMHPSSYGMAGWLTDDAGMIINDRYDLWLFDPQGEQPARRLTQGRADGYTYRYIRLDPEQRFIDPEERILLHRFDHNTKGHGYVWLNMADGRITPIQAGEFALTRRPLKAREAERYVYTKEDFRTFPDLIYGQSLAGGERISEANPQQSDYRWGTAELYEWTSLDGQRLQGLLVKPDGFDPNKKYPLIVNFYERSSEGLYRHRAPQAHRSTINYSYYASRGYVIFNPDIPYRVGYPGESAYNAVMSGVTNLLGEGFIDRERIGVQGHSWGGYQIAYLLTKTDMFRCAEAGAPVVNMISAYGGIRWGSGMSRMFQYERTQSRIGGTLWEYPLRYLENSPIFEVDKINTPVLILHNDNDGAVPWYQGIEFFVALRRLGKKAWMLNYNGEPHWPLKLANRKDFQRRMSQFFDYYLMDAPMPSWMQRGVPAIEKGILQGYE